MATQGTASLLAGRYRISRPLGAGGMATVFLCEDERLGREVAVKRLHANSPEDVARRFAREARLGALLNHPNLVSVYDTLTDGESVLIVMEYVEGETLRDALRQGPLPHERALAVVRDVAHALEHAHSHGVVHRDVKPANILLRKDGVVKLVDLGIATAADLTRITQSGTALGTASYMAPEQIDGRKAGAAADVYALAAVAYEALSGRKARQGNTPMEIAHKVATEAPPDLRDAWPDAPPRLAEVLRRGMARDPDDRPAGARDLCAEVDRAMEELRKPLPAAEPRRAAARGRRAAAVRPRRPESRWTTLAPAGALLALAVAAILLVTLSGGGDHKASQPKSSAPAKETPEPAAPAPPAPTGAQSAPAAPSPVAPGGSSSASTLNDQGYRLMKAGRYDDAIPLLRRAVAAFPSGSTNITYAYALYNLGRSLRLAGKPREAIPILERRLRIPNQTDTVRRELDAARRAASG